MSERSLIQSFLNEIRNARIQIEKEKEEYKLKSEKTRKNISKSLHRSITIATLGLLIMLFGLFVQPFSNDYITFGLYFIGLFLIMFFPVRKLCETNI